MYSYSIILYSTHRLPRVPLLPLPLSPAVVASSVFAATLALCCCASSVFAVTPPSVAVVVPLQSLLPLLPSVSVVVPPQPLPSAILVCRQDSAEMEQSEDRAVQWWRRMQLLSAVGPLRHTEAVLNHPDDLEE